MKSVVAKFLAVAMLAVGFAAPSFAAFSGPYDLSLWTQTNGTGGTGGTTIDISGAPDILIFNGGDSDLGCIASDCIVRFSIPVAGTGNITFNWVFDADDICCELFGFGVNGIPTQLSSFPVPVNGSETVPVVLGDTFQFYYDCTDCVKGGGTASVRGFNGPVNDGQVPEPASLALLAIGLLGLGASRLRVRRS